MRGIRCILKAVCLLLLGGVLVPGQAKAQDLPLETYTGGFFSVKHLRGSPLSQSPGCGP